MKKILYILPLLGLFACDLQKQVDLNLPEYEPKLVVESYLRPGQPFVVTLLESTPFFDDVQVQYVEDAEVVIRYGNKVETLAPLEISLNSVLPPGLIDTALLRLLKPILGDRVYFYASFNTVPEDFTNEFQLEINTPDGRTLSARTMIPAPTQITENEVKFDEDSLALVLTKVKDDPNQVNFYRRLMERVRIDTLIENGDTTTSSRIRTVQDFIVDDEVTNGQLLTFGTFYDYSLGDTLISTFYSITRDYYKFIETREAAIIASFSPFAPPTVVHTNIEGGIGIFTGFTFDQKVVVIGE